jgi:hypothetical protein
MKTIFKCEICGRQHKLENDAVVCETGHTVIRPSKWWLIPFVSWFAIPYHLFTKNKAIVVFNEKTFGGRILRDWVFMGPLLLTCIIGIVYIKFFC